MPKFSLQAIKSALRNVLERVGGSRPLTEAAKYGTAALVAGQLGPQVGIPEEIGTVPVAATIGAIKGLLTPTPVRSQTPQFTDTIKTFLGDIPIYQSFQGFSSKLTPTPAATPPATSKTTTTTSTKAPGAVAPTPAIPTAKAAVATPSTAPTPTATPPTPTTPITAKTGIVSTPPPTAGYSAPAPASLPPTPVMPGEMTQPTTPENLARFEAMIRALQELAGGARYVPMPAIGAEPFGPAGALERALRRLREREVRV